MKIYVMTDMEGVAGIQNSPDWCRPPAPESSGRYYDLGKELLTREVNAAVEGLFEGGATEVLVADGHGPGGIRPLLRSLQSCVAACLWAQRWSNAEVTTCKSN